MARPKIEVKHFIVCQAASWEGPAGPHTPRTLEGVCHRIGVPPGTEFPFEVENLWTYLRLFNTNAGAGTVNLHLGLIWTDASGGPRRIGTQPHVRIPFRPDRGVVETAVSVRPIAFPGAGWYEFRLTREVRLKWKTRRLIVAREQILIGS